MPANLENSAVATGLERVSFHSNSIQWQCQKMLKLPHNFTNLTHLEKQCSKFSKPGFNSTWAINLQIFKLDLEREKEPEIKFPMSIGSLKEQESSRKTSTSALLIMPKTLTLDHNKMWKILQELGIPDHLTCLLRNLYAGQEAPVRTDIEQQNGSKSGKEDVNVVYCHPAYLTSMQSASCEMSGWMKHKLE